MSAANSFQVPVRIEGGQWSVGRLDQRAMDRWLASREGQTATLTLAPVKKTRSSRQNRTYWGLVLPVIADETGHTTEEIHEFMKAMYLPRNYVQIGGREREVGKSTTDLSTAEFEAYLERVRTFAAEELGLVIPLPNED